MYKYPLTQSRNDITIYVNLINSLAGVHINRQPSLLTHIKAVLSTKSLTADMVSIEHDMGQVIGNSEIVQTSDKDTVFYAQPYKKEVYSRFVKNRPAAPSSKLTIILERDGNGDYELLDTWVGPCSPPFPGDTKATVSSKAYWETHALIMDAQIIQSKTITKLCPY